MHGPIGLLDSMVNILLTNVQSSDQPYNYILIHWDTYYRAQPQLINSQLITRVMSV